MATSGSIFLKGVAPHLGHVGLAGRADLNFICSGLSGSDVQKLLAFVFFLNLRLRAGVGCGLSMSMDSAFEGVDASGFFRLMRVPQLWH